MKYMILMNATSKGWGEFGTMAMEDIKRHIDFMHALNDDLKKRGEFVDAQGLTPPSEAKVVRAQGNGKPPITDGPFPEAKEFLAGFWIVELASAQRAIELAAYISSAPGKGGVAMNMPVELRPVGQAPKL